MTQAKPVTLLLVHMSYSAPKEEAQWSDGWSARVLICLSLASARARNLRSRTFAPEKITFGAFSAPR